MFILANYRKPVPVTFVLKNKLVFVKSKVGNVEFSAFEDNSPVQYFVFEEKNDDFIDKNQLIPSKLFKMHCSFEKPELSEEISYNNLIDEFGDKKSKDRVKKRALNNNLPKTQIEFNVSNQLIPYFDENAENPFKAFKIEFLFESSILEHFVNTNVNWNDFCDFVTQTEILPDRKFLYTIIDCLYKTVSLPFIDKKSYPKEYSFFFSELIPFCNRGKLSALKKDQLIVKLYIVILMAHDFSYSMSKLPKFNMPQSKLLNILKSIGCTIKRGGDVVLDRMPSNSYTSK